MIIMMWPVMVMSLSLLAFSSSVVAEEKSQSIKCGIKHPIQRSSTLRWENDMYITDEQYTNGMKFQFNTLYKDCESKDTKRKTHAIGMNMYTPHDIGATSIQYNDRPYAGWLYYSEGDVTINNDKKTDVEEQTLHEYTIGCLGPCAGQGYIQDKWHYLVRGGKPTGKPIPPLGWHNQIKNELGFVYRYGHSKVLYHNGQYHENNMMRKTYEVNRTYNVLLGNIFNMLEAGAIIRYGKLSDRFYNPFDNIIKRASKTSKPVSNIREKFVFFKTSVRAVLYNATIQGGLIDRVLNGESTSVYTATPRPFVFDIELGASYQFPGGNVLEYSLASRSTEITDKTWNLRDHIWHQLKFVKYY